MILGLFALEWLVFFASWLVTHAPGYVVAARYFG
jgi:hypothetical protein